MSISAYIPFAVNQPFRSSGFQSEKGSALSSAVEAITVHPAVGPQPLCFCKGHSLSIMLCESGDVGGWFMSETVMGFKLPSLTRKKGSNFH